MSERWFYILYVAGYVATLALVAFWQFKSLVSAKKGESMNPLRRWFLYLHGDHEPHQNDLYRCLTCGNIVTHNMIRSGDPCCGSRVSPTNPSTWEAIKLLVLPFLIGPR